MLDITKQAVVDTAFIHLKGADGEFLYDEGQPAGVVVYGPGTKQFAAIEARQTNRAVKRMQENDGKVTVASAEERAVEQAEDLADITVRFQNFTYPPAGNVDGTALFRAFYSDQALGFLAQQVMKACRDWGKFKQVSATS